MISAITCVLALVFLCPKTVYAANPSTYNDYTASQSSNGVNIVLRAVQFKSSSLGTSMLPGGMESVFFVTCEIRNNNTQAAVIRPITFDITITEDKTISHLYSYSSDLLMERQTWFKLVPSSEFSYASNGSELIVVPPETSLYFVGEICTTANLNQTGTGVEDAGLRGINFVENDYYVTKGDYPYGTPVDLSPITSYLDDLSYDLDEINLSISDIEDYIQYTGNFYQYNGASGTSVVLSKYFSTYIRGYANIFYGTPYLTTVDQVVESSTDTSAVNGTMRYPVLIRSFVFNNSASQDKATTETFNEISNFIPVGYVFHVQYFNSEIYGNVGITADGHLRFYPKNVDSNYQWILDSKHYYNTLLIGYVDVPINISLTWPTANINSFFSESFTNVSDAYNPPTEYTILRDLYLAYSEVNGLDNSSDISNDVADVSDSNHIIEESYYSANASAIEATGLSNYRFSNEQNNGIGKVADDFMLLWNALGSWNGVYVFSLTMALATFIMRHGGLFTVKREVSDKGGEGD